MLRENKHTKSHEKASEGACKTGSQCAYLKGALTEIYLEVVEGVLCLEAETKKIIIYMNIIILQFCNFLYFLII